MLPSQVFQHFTLLLILYRFMGLHKAAASFHYYSHFTCCYSVTSLDSMFVVVCFRRYADDTLLHTNSCLYIQLTGFCNALFAGLYKNTTETSAHAEPCSLADNQM